MKPSRAAILVSALAAIAALLVFSHKDEPAVSGVASHQTPSSLPSESGTETAQLVDGISAKEDESTDPEYLESNIPTRSNDLASTSTHSEITSNRLSRRIDRMERLMQVEFSSRGFSQHEIDVAIREIGREFRKGEETVNAAEAIDRTAKVLELNSARKNELNEGFLHSFGDSESITIQQLDQCLKFKTTNASPCVKNIASELSQSVSTVVATDTIAESEWPKMEELAHKATIQAVKTCGGQNDELEKILRLSLVGCP